MKTKSKPLSFLWGMYLVTVAMFAPGCTKAQQEDVKPAQKNEPKIHIDVKKEYDENGNVTRYDSTYSWTWSGGDTTGLDAQFFFRHGMGGEAFSFGTFPGFDSSLFSFGPIPGMSDSLIYDPFHFDMEARFREMDRMMQDQMKMFEEMQKQFFGNPMEAIPEENDENAPVQKKGISL